VGSKKRVEWKSEPNTFIIHNFQSWVVEESSSIMPTVDALRWCLLILLCCSIRKLLFTYRKIISKQLAKNSAKVKEYLRTEREFVSSLLSNALDFTHRSSFSVIKDFKLPFLQQFSRLNPHSANLFHQLSDSEPTTERKTRRLILSSSTTTYSLVLH
jgi:hypothetical protein